MQVYERRPTGMAPADLLAYGRGNPSTGRWAVLRLGAGLLLMVAVFAPLGALWFLIGFGLIVSLFGFVCKAGRAAMIRPAVVLTGTPKWEGTRRLSWEIDGDTADQIYAAAEQLADGLRVELGEPLASRIVDNDTRGVSLASALRPLPNGDELASCPSVVAWGVGRPPRLAADGETNGVWMRVDPPAGEGPDLPVVTILCNDGAARDALVGVAWRA